MTKISDYNVRAVGIAWIREEDYTACLAVFEDGNKFFPAWKQWNESAEKGEAEFRSQGYIVERVYIDPDTFTDWCRTNGVNTGREGRGHFAGDFVAKKYGRKSRAAEGLLPATAEPHVLRSMQEHPSAKQVDFNETINWLKHNSGSNDKVIFEFGGNRHCQSDDEIYRCV